MKFKALILKHGFSCSSLAKAINVSRGTVYYWINKRTLPKYTTLLQLSDLISETKETIAAAILEK